MDFLKGFDPEKLASQALNVIDEFPDRAGGPAELGQRSVGVAPNAAGKACAAWEELDWEVKQQEWEDVCAHLKGLGSKDASTPPDQWQRRAKDAEYQLLRLCNTLLGLPDPLPFLEVTSSLSSKLAELEQRNRELEAAAAAAAADSHEVSTLVEQHRALTAAHQQLKESAAAQEAEMEQARAAVAEASSARSQLEAQAGEVQRLQEALKVLRMEHERTQTSLFEVTNARDQEAGSKQREMELATEELERAQQRAAELSLERDTLVARLEAAQAAAQAGGSRQDGGAGPGAGEGGGSEQGEADPDSGSGSKEGFWERQVRVRSEQVAALQGQLSSAQQATANAAAQLSMQEQSWSNKLASAELSISKLEAELTRRPDPQRYQELASQVLALQQLIDVQMDAEGWGHEALRDVVKSLGLAPASTSQAVSSLQQERNRKLAADVSTLRRQTEAQTAELAAAQQELTAAKASAAAAAALADKLEGDLAAVRHAGQQAGLPLGQRSHPKLAASLGAAEHSQPPASGGTPALPGAKAAAPSSHAGSAADPAGPPAPVQGPSTPESSDPSSSASLLDIVISQRDRFRQRMGQLEEEKGALGEQLAQARQQLEACRADNIALYEKVRYIEQFQGAPGRAGGKGTGSGGGAGNRLQVVRVDGAGVALESQAPAQRAKARYQCGPVAFEIGGGPQGSDSSLAMGVSGGGVRARGAGAGPRKAQGFCFPTDDPGDEEAGGPESRYAQAYEARVNPFTDFQKSEVELRVRSLQLHDRAMLAGSKLLVGSRFARAFVATYAVLLHLFIMVLLYYAMAQGTGTAGAATAATAATAAVQRRG